MCVHPHLHLPLPRFSVDTIQLVRPSQHAQFLWEDPFMPRGILDMDGVSSNSKHCKYCSLRAKAACWLCTLSGSSDVTRAIGSKQV